MPVLATTVETTTTQEVQLTPAVKRKLLTELKAYAAIVDQIKVLEHAKDKHKGTIGKIREDADAQTLKVEGFTITLCAPIRKKWNPKKFVALGGVLEYFTMAHDEVLSRPFEKITLPNSSDEDE